MLYERDYRFLDPEEQAQLRRADDYLNRQGRIMTVSHMVSHHRLMPEAAYYYRSLFPNNYLFVDELGHDKRLQTVARQFLELLDTEPNERTVLNFINANRYYFLIGAILKSSYFFGHHGAYVFKEFELPPNYIADYLLVGENSGGYEFVFVEMESPAGAIVNADGTFGTTIRKGLKQIEDWDEWIDGNFSHLRLLFQKHIGTQHATLPNEFISLEKSRIHYALVAGRRKDYKSNTYRLRRKLKHERNITLLHYDNIVDTIPTFRGSANY